MRRTGVLALLLCLAGPATLLAQQTRNDRLAAAQRAYFDDFDAPRARTLLREALNPAQGPQDSLWARGVQLFAQILVEAGNQDEAAIWLRWAFRLAPSMAIDTVTFLPEVVQAIRDARTAAQPSPGDPVTRTTWQWTAQAPQGQGALRVSAPGLRSPVNVLVQGAGLVQGGQSLALRPGTHQIQAAAEGYLTTQLSREVLPGITTVLEFNLVAATAGVLAAGVRDAAFQRVVPLSVRRFQAQQSCATGAMVGRDGLVLASYESIRGAEGMEATLPGNRRVSQEIRVAAWDIGRNLAVLQIPGSASDSIPPAPLAVAGQFVYALGLRGCQTATDARARIATATGPTVELADSINPQDNAGAVIDGEGRLVGFLSAPRRAASLAIIRELVATARRNLGTPEAIAVAEVSLRERHAYGSVAITADVTGVTGRITPLETWQWAGLAWSGPLPYTFSGPTGRYQLDLTIPGQAQPRRVEFTVRAGAAERFPVATRQLAAEERQVGGVPQRGGKKFPWPIAVVGAGGLGALAFLLLGGGGGGGPGDTGGLTILLPTH